MYFDTHAHYDDERFDSDRHDLLASLPEEGVALILNPGCDGETSAKAVEYANQHTIGAIKELVFAIFMDENFNIIDTNLVASGTINEARPTLRNVLELCVLKRATRMILFHNHPSGDCEPSVEDIDMTIMLKRELEIIGVTLVEHLIVDGRGGYCALVERIYDKKNDYYQ